VTLYDKTIGRVTGFFDRSTDRMADGYTTSWTGRCGTAGDHGAGRRGFRGERRHGAAAGHRVRAQVGFLGDHVNFYTPVGSSLEVTEAKARQVETIIREFPEVNYTLATLNTGNALGKTNASIYVRMVDRNQRKRSVDEVSSALRARLAQVPGVTVTHVGLLDPVGGQKQIEFSLQGPDLKELDRLTRLVMDKIRATPAWSTWTPASSPTSPPSRSMCAEAASELGLGMAQIAGPLRTLVAGQTVGNWRASDDQTYDVNVRLSPESRTRWPTWSACRSPPASTPTAAPRIVRLNQVATCAKAPAQPDQPPRPDRESHQRQRLRPLHRRGVGRHQGRAGRDRLPAGVPLPVRRRPRTCRNPSATPSPALVLAIVFIYMILASQFKSFLQPLALMTSLPLTLIGVVLALLMFGSSLNMFSIIGIVMLMGLVTKNAILLVDFAIRAREDGMERSAALLMAARVRLRPILMTTLAMVFGMVPLAFALTEGSEQRAPMGQAVIGGVITSSLLTLVVVPVVYCYMDDLAQWMRRRFGAGAAHQPGESPAR
jgi:HAE1 family hydrophobic/amphiphilic exporter-1